MSIRTSSITRILHTVKAEIRTTGTETMTRMYRKNFTPEERPKSGD